MKRNKFNLSHYKLLTCNMGKLVPITWFEVLPGDTIQQSTSLLVRVSPLLAPLMHPVRVRVHHWYVPNRLIWDDWEDFITGGPDGTSLPTHPYVSAASITKNTTQDYLGVPPASYSPDIVFSALPIRAYQLIFNENYRDQDLVTEVAIDTSDGLDTTPTTIRTVAWEKDYFTSARPWTQKGDQVTIPLGDDAPITGIGKLQQTYASSGVSVYETDGTGTVTYTNASSIDSGAGGTTTMIEEDPNNSGFPNIRADLSAATGIDINDLRLAVSLQHYQEARAKYGSRYTEYLRQLGIISSDARLQRPEYLGGGRQTLQFSEVLQTAEGSDYVGTMRGHGISAMKSNTYRKFFEEHGIVMTLLSVVPKAIYATGLHKSFNRTVKEDYFQKELQAIGDQEVYNKEVYTEHTNPDEIFGYQGRYEEYKTLPSSIAADFRDDLNHWHMARIFSSDPALNSTFVQCNPTDRIYASTADDQLYIMASHNVVARRQMARNPDNLRLTL